MDTTKIGEGNELIARFMDYEREEWDDEPTRFFVSDHLICTSSSDESWDTTEDDWTSWMYGNEMKFHTDWNWLMPVVKEIVPPKGWSINLIKKQSNVMNKLQYANIDDVWVAVVEFIEAYNSEIIEILK